MKHFVKNTLLSKILILSGLFILILTNCQKEDSIDKEPPKEKAPFKIRQINNFIHENMSFFYFWNEEMPDIDPDYETESKDYFKKLLKKPDDRWSFITDDYEGLKNYFAGVQKSVGYSLLPVYLRKNSNQVVAFIEYVYRDSPASKAGLKRGDMIYKIDGQILTDENLGDLLSKDAFELTLGKINPNNPITELSPSLSLTAIELNQHPIIATSITSTMGHKIGYLAYASFTANYDTALVNTFEQFQKAGVTELVLDLRYNGGGSVSTASLLGDMLVPPGNEGNTFIKRVFNTTWSNYLKENEGVTEDYYKIPFEANDKNLNISKLYALTTRGTASASEMVIYGLAPYMDVIQVGDTTHGKYYGSITLSDEEKHNWAIQPLVMRSINSTNDINYTMGLLPDHYLPDYFYNFPAYQLGDPQEVFFAKAISLITGEPFPYEEQLKSASTAPSMVPDYSLRKELDPLRTEMYLDPPENQQ